MTQKLTESNISECQAKFNLSYHVPFAHWCQQMIGFEGKDVLEVGGSLPKEFVLDYLNVKSWSALEAPDFEVYLDRGASNHEGSKLGKVDYSAFGFTERELSNYNFFAGYIEELPPAYYQKYDLIFSIAAFEHIHKFPLALEKMFLALKPGGQLFSIFTPIWSAHDGHHLPPITEPNQGKTFNFQNSPIPPWGHLLMRPPELCRYLYQHTDKETADAIAYYVYNAPHINRFFTEDYVEFINQSSFIVKRLEAIGLIQIEKTTQETLEKLYPDRTQFANNGILAVLEKPENKKKENISEKSITSVSEQHKAQLKNDHNPSIAQTKNQVYNHKPVQVSSELSGSPIESLSVCMIVQNAEKTLDLALESLNGVYDELIVVDGGSTDSTCEIALRYGAKVIHSAWTGNFSDQRNVSLKEVKSDWVFIIDADEFIDLKTLEFLRYLKANGTQLDTEHFWITRKWISPFSKNHYVSSAPHYPDWQHRIFRYNQSLAYSRPIHEGIHGLTKPGETLLDLCVYHLDLLIKSESQRQEKVRIYSSVNERDGMPHFYLPDIRQLTIERWNHQYLLPKVKNLLDHMPLKCKVCESDSHHFAPGKVMGKYDVDYFQCSNCGFVQTEEPYWLDEAYSQPIASSDVGLAFRNLSFSKITQSLLFNFFNHQAIFLDYGGGYGLFVRLMRDAGFDFYWFDKFCKNIFAQGFEIDAAANNQFELVTAFEVFEHLVHPIDELEELLKISRNILLSTELLPQSNPKPNEWWYYVLHEGQHVSFYTAKSLSILAAKFNLNFYSNGSSLHLLTEKHLPEDLFEQLAKGELAAVNKESFLQKDFLKAFRKITNIQQEAKIPPSEIEEDGDSRSGLTILVDGVFFQHNNTGIARVWKSLWQEWANTNFAQNIIILDRNGTAPKIPGIRYRTIPLYDYGNTDRDRAMLQQICDEEKAGLFISTYYTTPLSTPSVFMAYDMIPELMGQNIGHSEWREKHCGIRHASAYITISENTARDLVKVFPHISSNSIAVAHCGMDANFSPAEREEISGFKSKYSITKPYFLLVGERVGWHGYKNGILFFKAFSQLANKFEFDIVCVGGKPVLEPELRLYSSGITVHTLQLSDSELKAAYSGALVLVYPSKYEGFGLPVLEAMACGCPVITCPNGSIPEVAGKAAVYVNGDDVIGLVNALLEIQKPGVRNSLIAAGLEQAKKFSWSKMAAIVSSVLVQVAERAHSENASVQQPTDAGLQGEFGNGENSQPVQSAFKVSAIVSTYNSEKFIRGCLQDLVEQTLYKQGQLEIIVIDSGSQENEQSVVREFQAKYPNIVYDRTSDRETLYAAWNRGIKMSRGAYMTNANTDDRHRPDALEIMAKYLDENAEVSLVYADQLITNTANDTFAKTQAQKRWNWPAFDYSELERRCIIGPQPMWRKSLHEKYGYFRTEFTAAGDYEFWLRIGKTENIVCLPEILGLYCENQQGLEHSSPISQQETRQIWDEYGIARRGVKPATTLPVSISPLQLNAMPYRTSAETLVSVIIPCYNHATLLREAVESVVSQTYPNWECIIVNDGSTDDTSNFAKYLIKLYPQKSLRLIDKANTGPADSRNLGVQQSSGKFILFLDADDKLHPKFLEECVEILLAKPNVGFVYTDVQHFGANCDLVIHGDFEANRFLRDNQAPATSLFRREIYEQVGGLKKVMKLGCEDWEFWISAYEKGWLGERLPKPYLYYRQHGDGSSRTQKMAGDRPKLDLMRATIIHLHSQLYKPEEVRWSQQILQQHGNLMGNELVEFNKPEQFLTLLSQYVGEYQKDQANEVNLANIRQSRQQLANYWLNLPAEQLANAYSGDAGKAHQLLLNSYIKDEALTDAEKTVIDRLAAHLSQGIKTPKDINYLLAAALYRRADQLWLNYQNAAIPNWFVNGYLKFMFAAPTLFQEIGEADNYCRYMQGWVSYLHSNIFKKQNSQVWQDIAGFFTQGANFIPLYFNSENLKDIYTKRADIIEYTLKNRGAAIDCIFPARPANRQKIRVGVLTKHFGAMTETFATLPAFEYLNREQFEIILYALNLDGNKLEQYCQSRADRLVKLSNDLPSQVQTIRADDLDILLIATNITAVTHPISLLALHRLARVQTTCFNSPITTGMRHVDYYIAGKLMEPAPEGQEHYREQLATIDGPGCCFSYTLEPYTPNINFTRNSLGISEESVVFISSANLYKLVPELRETWAKIMAAVPNSLLFLMPFGPSWTNHYPGGAFVNNMKAVFAKYGIESNRLRVLKSLPNRADVKEVLKLGDVYLDSYPYAGTTSLVDPLEVGLPTVVRDGDTLRSRMGAAVVRSLSMPDLIANSEASYIQLAVTLGTNPELRQRYRQEIHQKMQANPACFDSVAYSAAIGKLFQELFGKWQTSHQEASRSLQDSIPKEADLGEILSNAVNLYQRNSSNISAISELRQIRKQIADFWLNVPAENLETVYKSASGNSYQILLKSGSQHQAMIESEQMFLQQLTQISKGLVHPKAVNALLAAMLYFPPGTMRIPDARNRLPHWLIEDYEQVFETEAAVLSDSSSDLLAQYIQSPQFANQLLGCVNLYRIDPSDESVVLELRQIRKQMSDFWLTVPSEKLENFYRGEVGKGYRAILKCGLQAESMTEAEQQFLQRLTEISKGLVQPQAINALLGAMLYFVPGKMRVPDARTRLPQWLLEDYEKVFESAFATTEQTVVKQDYLPQFLNQLTAAVNLYEIDPTAELVIADLRHIRKQIADLWLSVSGEQVEILYRSDFGKGYKAMLGSGFIKEPLHESEREFFNSLVVELSKGFGAPKAVNNLLAAMLYCRLGQLRVQDANTCLPPWLLADYEQLVGGAVKVAVG